MNPDTRLMSITWASLSIATTRFSKSWARTSQHEHRRKHRTGSPHLLDLVYRHPRAQRDDLLALELLLCTGTLERSHASLHQLLETTGVAREAVDRVFLTGGTSLVPAVRRVFTQRFGEERVRGGEAFTSVAYGLALLAGR